MSSVLIVFSYFVRWFVCSLETACYLWGQSEWQSLLLLTQSSHYNARVEDLYQQHRISEAAYRQGQAKYQRELAKYENQIAKYRGTTPGTGGTNE